MKQAYVKGTDRRIVGVLETVTCRADISGFDGQGDYVYSGGSEMFWDEQRPVERDGKTVFLDEDGEEVTEDEIEFRVDSDDFRTFEITAAGFSAEDDSTDDRVFWVKADSREAVEKAIADTGATCACEIEIDDSDIDFVLPDDGIALQEALLEFAGSERNKNR